MGDQKALQLKDLKSIKDRFSFAGKNAMITGGAGGIGRTVGAALAELGANIALVDIRKDMAQENADFLAKKFGVKTVAEECDVSSEAQVKDLFARLTKTFAHIDAVHSNAGILAKNDCGDIEFAEWEKIVKINLTGMFLINQASAHHMKGIGGGAIVNTASMSAHIVNRSSRRHMLGYTSTKAAALHLTKSMAMDYVKDNIRVNSISPGYMLSGLHDDIPQEYLDALGAHVPMGRFGTMDEIGGLVVFLLSDLASYITGADVIVDGGYCVW
jgi:NAD(P)-dependent dehydrogenase (short-subunit alcohol dehydrogenase family)